MTKVIEILSKFDPHSAQQKILLSVKRFIIVVAGRRFGKSVLAVNCCIERAIAKPNQKVWYCSPLYKQTKEIAWSLFSYYLPNEFILKRNEAELKITLRNGSEIALKGTDNPDSLVGVGLNFVVLDECAMMKSDVWKQIVRPMLIDTKGEALFITSPRGFGWLKELWDSAKDDADFDRFHFTTIDNTAISTMSEEVEKARKEAKTELEKILFRQEYEATFECVTGRPRFDLEIITKLSARLIMPTMQGNLNVLHPLDPKARYVIGCDTSEGLINGDKSTAVMLNMKEYRVDAYYKGSIPPDIFASYLASWGAEYNNAKIIVESNNHGLVTLNYLKEIYTNVYFRKVFDEVSNEWTDKLGFQTNAKTKPLLIASLDRALRAGLKIEAGDILDELKTYIIEEDGKTNAAEGAHDDLVIGLALTIQAYMEATEHEGKDAEPEILANTPAHIFSKIEKSKEKVGHRYERVAA